MALYGVSRYGQDFYGYDIPPAYRVDPFQATPINYTSVQITWSQPSGNILAYRLVKNRYGFPVDQDDGQILVDSLTYPGNQFIDTSVVPGTYQYYGFYVLLSFLTNKWVRSGLSACLIPSSYSSGTQIRNLIPGFYEEQGFSGTDAADTGFPDSVLDNFCLILGWGLDYLKTQYDTYAHVNDPWKISQQDLYSLATELGLNINPDIHPFTLRKAVFYNAVVNQNRGTTSGLVQELSALTGWSADLQIAPNFMLENDQSAFLDPPFQAWSSNIAYNTNEYISYQNYWYQCVASGNLGNPPTGTNSANAWWVPIVGVNNNTFLRNSATGGINTWELIYPAIPNGIPASASFYEVLGAQNPLAPASFTYNGLTGFNKSGSTGTIWLRSVSRTTADLSTVTTTFAPNKDQVTGDGIPVPFVTSLPVWNGITWSPSIRYSTGQIVTYNNQPFMARRASTNMIPPYSNRAGTNSGWAPVSLDQRFRICISSYVNASTGSILATPFVEWYDANGNFITRVIARSSNAGVVSLPAGLIYDSFTSGYGTAINARTTDDGSGTWTQVKGVFQISPDSQGSIYPAITSQRTYATVNGNSANCAVAVTFVTNPLPGDAQGLILRWQDDNNYVRASMTELDIKQSGTWSVLGTYSSAANPGDRLMVKLNGSSITVFINNTQVLAVTSNFNIGGTIHGLINEGTVVVTSPGTQSNLVNVSI